MDLVGKKIALCQENDRNGHSVYRLADPIIEQQIRNEIGGEVRIFTPGTYGTDDYKMFRTNIFVDENNVITRVTQG